MAWLTKLVWNTSTPQADAAEDALLARSGLELGRNLLRTQVPVRGGDEHMHTVHTAPLDPAKPNLVVAHGFGTGGAMFWRNMASLAALHNVFVIDWLGCGRSSRPRWKARTPAEGEAFFIDALEEWRQHMGLQRFRLLGHSLGGYLSACYTMRHPSRVSHLVLASPVGIPHRPPPEPEGQNSMLFSLARAAWGSGITPQGFARACGAYGRSFVEKYVQRRFVHHTDEQERADIIDYLFHCSFVSSGSGEYALNTILQAGAWARDPLCDRLPEAKGLPPMTFLYGEYDWMDSSAARDLIPTLSTPATVSVIPSSGHHLYMENYKAFNAAVLQALSSSCGLDDLDDGSYE